MDGLFLACLMGICGLPESHGRLDPPALVDQGAPRVDATAAVAERPVPQVASAVEQFAPTGSAKLSRAAISEVVQRNTPAIRRCYERGLVEDQTFSGTVEIAWKIQVDGRVSTVSVLDASKRNSAVEDCLLAEIMRWKFPPSSEPTAVGVYPFALDARLLSRHARHTSP
jgi:outer membrane biosynthesis protein TonB